MARLIININGEFLEEAKQEATKRNLAFREVGRGGGGGSYDVELIGGAVEIEGLVREWYHEGDEEEPELITRTLGGLVR